MDHNTTYTYVFLGRCPVSTKAKECLERLLITTSRRLSDFIIIDPSRPRLLGNLIALLRFARQILFSEIQFYPTVVHPATRACFQFHVAPVVVFPFLKREWLAGFDLCYNWSVRSFLLEQIRVAVRVVDDAAKFWHVCKRQEFTRNVLIGFVADAGR